MTCTFAAAVFVLLLCSCTPIPKGDVPDPHRYAELVPGVSTVEDAVAKLGQPRAYTDIGHGRILLQWFDYRAPNPIHLAISFSDTDRRMIEVQSVTLL